MVFPIVEGRALSAEAFGVGCEELRPTRQAWRLCVGSVTPNGGHLEQQLVWGRTIAGVSDAAPRDAEAPHGTSLLPADLTEEQLLGAPVLESVDSLVIEDLTDEEDDAFAAAVES